MLGHTKQFFYVTNHTKEHPVIPNYNPQLLGEGVGDIGVCIYSMLV